MNTIVISAYPCCGKTYAYNNQEKYSILDSDSSNFSWEKDCYGRNTKNRDPKFPKNYVKHIQDNIGMVDIIFVSSHLIVREALKEAGINFCTIYPKETMLNEWIGRMYRRGSSKEFIEFQINHWDEFMKNLVNEPTGTKIYRLGNNEYIDLDRILQ